MGDEVLWTCNESELLALARQQGLPRLRFGLSKERLVSIVGGYADPIEDEVAATRHSRRKLQDFIWHPSRYGSVRSQLPGCDGRCTTWPCSEGRHLLCFAPNRLAVT